MPRSLPLLLLLAACEPAPDADACRPGFTRAADGRCWPPPPDPEPPSATDVIEGLPDCVSREPDGLVDLDAGCAAGACAGATIADWALALGDEDIACVYASWSTDWAYCSWPVGLEGLFPVAEGGVIEPEARTDWVHLQPRFPGATEDGLGVGISPRCWIDALGTPSSAVWVDRAGALELQDLTWSGYGVDVHDWVGPDGVVDDVYLFGAG